jgi:hypothetical protein
MPGTTQSPCHKRMWKCESSRPLWTYPRYGCCQSMSPGPRTVQWCPEDLGFVTVRWCPQDVEFMFANTAVWGTNISTFNWVRQNILLSARLPVLHLPESSAPSSPNVHVPWFYRPWLATKLFSVALTFWAHKWGLVYIVDHEVGPWKMVFFWRKEDETMGLVSNLRFMKINTKSSKFFWCLNNHTQIVVLNHQKANFQACASKMGRPS